MSGNVQERYHPVVLGVNATNVITNGEQVAGFLAVTSGTITITKNNAALTPVVTAVPVTAGIYTPIPFYVGHLGAVVTLAGGASGTLGV